jgi:hypothetical protein
MIPPIWPDVKPLAVGVHFWGLHPMIDFCYLAGQGSP